ncbi:MAG: prolipoprotein diacylglyceryl transferase [Nannocystaceae bacterium]|nr:prolipoprotein diacylglyceryl transferase [Nannocystaceae bacterium]
MSPVLFTIPGTQSEVSAYGFFIGLALVVGWIAALRLAARDGLPVDRLGTSYVVTIALALVAGRAAWLLMNPSAWQGWISLITMQQGGVSAPAALACALLVAWVHVSRIGVPLAAWLDVLAPVLAAGVALEATGALLGGTGFGRYAPDAAFAMRFPLGSPAYVAHATQLPGLLPRGATESLPVYPTQLVALVGGVIGLLVAAQQRRHRKAPGQVALITAAQLLAWRAFVEEPMRADRSEASIGPLSRLQLLAAVLVVVFVLIARARARRAAAPKSGRPPPAGAKR